MNYERIFSRAWQITWKYKPLWVFGFLAGLFIGSNNNSNNFIQGGAWLFQNIGSILSTNSLITILTVIISIVFWLVGTVARISLVREVAALDTRRPQPIPSLGNVFRAASKFMPSILLMQLLIWSPILVLNLIVSIVSQPAIETLFSSSQTGAVNQSKFLSSFGSIWIFACGIGLLTLPLVFIDAFAYRSIVLEELSIKTGLQKAIHILRANLKPILVLSIICLIIGLIFSFVIGLALLPLLPLVMRPMMQNVSQCASSSDFRAMVSCMQRVSTNPTVVIVGLIASVIGAALSAIWVAFQSATFTLAYNKLAETERPA